MRAIFHKEFKSLSCSFTGYLFSAVFLLAFGIFSLIYNLNNGQAGYSTVLSLARLSLSITDDKIEPYPYRCFLDKVQLIFT